MFLKSLVTLQSSLFYTTQVTVDPGSSTTVESTESTAGGPLDGLPEAVNNATNSGIDLDDPSKLAELGNKLLGPLTLFAVVAAIGSLIVIAIRIMFARATGDVDGAKKSSNGIGWIIGALVLVFAAPALVFYFMSEITN